MDSGYWEQRSIEVWRALFFKDGNLFLSLHAEEKELIEKSSLRRKRGMMRLNKVLEEAKGLESVS